MKKLSMVMAVVMLCVSCLFVSASADTEAAAKTLKVTAVSQKVETGQEFTLSVDFSENTGFNTLGVKLTYPEGFTYTTDSAAPSELIAEKCYLDFGGYSGETYTFYHDANARTIKFVGASLNDITEESGTLFTAKFTAPADAVSGAVFSVEIDDEIYASDGDTVTGEAANGTVDASLPYKLGDVTGDGRIKLNDAVWVLEYTLSKRDFTDTQKLSANVNTKNARINLADAVWILEYTLSKRTEFK